MASLRNTPVTGLNWGNMLALAPSVKAKLGKGLILEKVPSTPVGSSTAGSCGGMAASESNIAEILALDQGENERDEDETDKGFLYGEAIPEPQGPVANFYTTGTITCQDSGRLRVFRIPKVLVDGGAVVNLIPDSVVSRLGLPCIDNDDVVIRTATNELYLIRKRTQFNTNITGVLASVKAYVIACTLSYSLILGRRWMQQVRAMGNYTTHTCYI